MKRIIVIFIMIISLMLPKNAAASFDFLKNFLEIIGLSEEDITSVVNDYVEHEIGLQELTTDLKNQKYVKQISGISSQVSNLKDPSISGYAEFLNSSLSNLQWPGLDAATDAGGYTTPQTKKQTALSYFKKQHVRNDVQVNLAKDIAINNLAIENLAIDYGNGLSMRYNLQQEMKKLADEENAQDSGDDVQALEWNYGVIARRANHRWLEILRFEASHIASMLESQENSVRIDDMSEVLGEDAADAMQNLQEQGARTPESGSNGMDSGKAANAAKAAEAAQKAGQAAQIAERGIQAIKNKDYSSAFSSMSSLYGDTNPKVAETLNRVSGNVSTGQYLYNDVSNGNYESTAAAAFDAGKDYYNQQKAKNAAKGSEGTEGGSQNGK